MQRTCHDHKAELMLQLLALCCKAWQTSSEHVLCAARWHPGTWQLGVDVVCPLALCVFSERSVSGHDLHRHIRQRLVLCVYPQWWWFVQMCELCLGSDIRQLTCRLDSLTFSGWHILSRLIWTRLREMSAGTATLTPGIMNNSQEACLLCHCHTVPSPGQLLTFIGGWEVYSQHWFQKSELNSHSRRWALDVRRLRLTVVRRVSSTEKGLMSPTGFNSSKLRHQIDNLMIHIMKTGYKLRTSWVELVILIWSGAESL